MISSVVPPPISSRQTPRSRSSCVREDSAAARGSSTVSLIKMPARFAAVTRFCVAEPDEVTTWTLASNRWPIIPTGSRIPCCASTRNSCGRTWRTSRSSGRVMLRAASMARRTSSRSISRERCPRVTPPRLFTPRTKLPATPITADSTGTLATPSASSTARRMELTVESRLTINPLRRPLDSAAPRARNFTSSPEISAISTHVFVLPISNPITYLSFFAKLAPKTLILSRLRHRGAAARVGIQNHLPRILQVDGTHATIAGLPLSKIVDDQAIFAREIVLAELDGDRLGVVWRREAGHYRSQILCIREVNFADTVRRTRAHQINIFDEILVRLHAPAALVPRRVVGEAGDDGELVVFGAGPIEYDTMRINESKFGSIAQERDWCAFCNLDANAIGQNALDAGGLDPGQFLEGAAAGVEGVAQDAVGGGAGELWLRRLSAQQV